MKSRPIQAAVLALSLAGGGLDCAQTAGESIVYEASVGAALADGSTDVRRFETAGGWSVELEEARVLLGPMVFYGGGLRAQRSPLAPSVAFAHPSDDSFDKGPVLGDVLDQYVVDLLGAPTDLGVIPGVAGTIQTMELELQPPGYTSLASPADELAKMGAHTFILAGSAHRDGVQVNFRAEGDLPGEPLQRVVSSIEVDVTVADRADRPGRLHVEVLLDEWLRFVDFSAPGQEDELGQMRFPADSAPGLALRRGIRSRFAFGARWRDS